MHQLKCEKATHNYQGHFLPLIYRLFMNLQGHFCPEPLLIIDPS